MGMAGKIRALALAAFSLFCPLAHAEDMTAIVVSVTDGDTIKATLQGEMPELFKHQSVRLLGCDTPEKKDPRPEVSALAYQAKDFTTSKVPVGETLELRDVAFDKYGGRLLAHVAVDGRDLCETLIESGLAKPYFGGKKEW